jgi:hypothetical protein
MVKAVGVLGILLGAVVVWQAVFEAPPVAVTTYRGGAECRSLADRAANRGLPFPSPVCDAITSASSALATSAMPPAALDSQSYRYPLKVSANRRYLVDQDDRPFLMMGDSPQALFGDLSEADAELFLANRQAAGFNTVWVNLLCNAYTGCNADGTTFDGIAPFTNEGDLSTPNEAYFSRVDRMLALADKYGMVVLLDPIETGGWLDMLKANGIEKAYNYGQYLGNRYKSVPNIVWMSGNDFQDWRNADNDAAVMAVARGLQDSDSNRLQTVEFEFYESASLQNPNWEQLIQLDAAYSYHPTYSVVLQEYNRPNYVPVFMVEANYEFERNLSPPVTTAELLRRQGYWTMLSGATGQLYGNKYTWQFIDGWKTQLDTIGSMQMGYVTALFGPRAWYDLVPDQDHSLVTSGYGAFKSDGGVADSDYATAARTSDGRLAIAYMPTGRTLTVDLSKMSGTLNAKWYDPTRGTFIAAGSGLANSGSHDFTPPAKNADGDTDWVLVLEAD